MRSATRHIISVLVASFLAAIGLSTVDANQYPITDSRNGIQERAEPVIVLIEYDPWSLVIGADSPSFVLYNSGLLVFRTDGRFQSVVLNSEDYDTLIAELNIGDEFFELDAYYDLALATDQPTNTIHVWRDGQRKTVSVYGDLHSGDFLDMSEVPAPFLHLFEMMTSYENADAQNWVPERIEVLLWSTTHSNGVAWPTDFPSLNSEFAVRRSGDQFSVFVESSQLDRLSELYDESSTILINETAWSFAWRWPFPNELAWRSGAADELPTFTDLQAEMSAFGTGILDSDEWSLSLSNDYAENNFLSVSATWMRDEPFTTAHFSRQLIRTAFPDAESLAAAVNDTWLAIEWMDFQAVELVNQCVVSEVVIVEIVAEDQGLEVVARYWVWQDDLLLSEFRLVATADHAEARETLSESLFPDAPRCPSE